MTDQTKKFKDDLDLPKDAAEEFAAAIEASTGIQHSALWSDPMSPFQIIDAFNRLLMTPRPDRGLEVLVRSDVMKTVFPEVFSMVGFGEGIRHKDVWAHTKQVTKQTPARLVVRWAGLLHDIGKVSTRRFESNGQVTFIGHPEIGARMFERIARRFPFPEEPKNRLRFLIASHLRAAAYQESWTDSAVRRFTKDAGDALDDLLDLSRADITSKHEEKVKRGLRQINFLATRIEDIKQEDSKPAPLPKGLGHVLIQKLNITPGPELGLIMDKLKLAVEDGKLGIQQDFDHYVEFLQTNPTILNLKLSRKI